MDFLQTNRKLNIRFKRKDTTLFLFCDGSDTFSKIKSVLFSHFGAKEEKEINLWASDCSTKYADMAMVSDFAGLSDNSIVLVAIGEEVPQPIAV